jgi:hypothetical protein
MDLQARIPPALTALHNYIIKYDPIEQETLNTEHIQDPTPGNFPTIVNRFGTFSRGPPSITEKARAKNKRDGIAQAMWENYQAYLAEQMEEDVLE